ncbi:MAG: iron-containing redox enzyme family protein [Chloroflexota bacterium]
MATMTVADNRAFIAQVLEEIVRPGADRLMASRYFTDLQNGTLTTRRLQGWALQHYWFNQSLIKGYALRMVRGAESEAAFNAAVHAFNEEQTHPAMAKRFGLALGLTEADFAEVQPIHPVLAHTGAVLASMYVLPNLAQRRASGLANETMVQRYATALDQRLREAPYNMSADALTFFVVHGVADIRHSQEAADHLATIIKDDHDRQVVRAMAQHMVDFKLAKFEGIYEAYA